MNATEAYQTTRLEIDAKIARIQALLKELDAQQAADPQPAKARTSNARTYQFHWGHVGNVRHVNSELDELVSFLERKEA